MKRLLSVTAFALLASHAMAQQATFTGDSEFVQTITGRQGVRCGYYYGGQRFDRVFTGTNCPSVVDVEVPQSSSSQGGLMDCEGLAWNMYQQCKRFNEAKIRSMGR